MKKTVVKKLCVYVSLLAIFLLAVSSSFAAGEPVNVGEFALADVNGDGKMDAVQINNSGQVRVGLSYGRSIKAWSWDSQNRMLEDNSKTWLADVNGDGKADLVTQSAPGLSNAGHVYVGLSNGTGFEWWSWGSPGRILDDNSNTWLADVNGDRKVDLVTLDENGYMHVGLTDGKSFEWWSSDTITSVNWFSLMQFGDVNGDGKTDYVGQNTTGIHLRLSNGRGFYTHYPIHM